MKIAFFFFFCEILFIFFFPLENQMLQFPGCVGLQALCVSVLSQLWDWTVAGC